MSTAHPSTPHSDCHSFGCSLAELCHLIAGGFCLVVGAVLTMTFWLTVIGIPLALLGVALIVADRY